MKRSGGFAVVEVLIAALVIAIIALGGYYVVKRNHHDTNIPSASVTSNLKAVSPASPAPSAASGTLEISKFGIKLVNIPDSIKDLTYTYYPANTDSNFTQASFTTDTLRLKAKDCSIGTLNRYPGKYSEDKYQGPGNFVKQFKDFWILEIDEGIPCNVNQSAQDMQNSQIITFKQYVTKPDNLQEIN